MSRSIYGENNFKFLNQNLDWENFEFGAKNQENKFLLFNLEKNETEFIYASEKTFSNLKRKKKIYKISNHRFGLNIIFGDKSYLYCSNLNKSVDENKNDVEKIDGFSLGKVSEILTHKTVLMKTQIDNCKIPKETNIPFNTDEFQIANYFSDEKKFIAFLKFFAFLWIKGLEIKTIKNDSQIILTDEKYLSILPFINEIIQVYKMKDDINPSFIDMVLDKTETEIKYILNPIYQFKKKLILEKYDVNDDEENIFKNIMTPTMQKEIREKVFEFEKKYMKKEFKTRHDLKKCVLIFKRIPEQRNLILQFLEKYCNNNIPVWLYKLSDIHFFYFYQTLEEINNFENQKNIIIKDKNKAEFLQTFLFLKGLDTYFYHDEKNEEYILKRILNKFEFNSNEKNESENNYPYRVMEMNRISYYDCFIMEKKMEKSDYKIRFKIENDSMVLVKNKDNRIFWLVLKSKKLNKQ